MKVNKVFLSLFFLAFFVIRSPVFAQSQSCSNLSASADGSAVTITLSGCTDGGFNLLFYNYNSGKSVDQLAREVLVSNGTTTVVANISIPALYKVSLVGTVDGSRQIIKEVDFQVTITTPLNCGDSCNPNDTRCPSECPSVLENGQWICRVSGNSIPNNPINVACNNNTGVITALGCIPTNDMNSFAAWLLSKAILIAGGIAFVLMSIGVFQITTSAGDPKKVQAGSELITSTLSGLLFIILSVFLLKLIGVDVLHLPGLGQ